MTEPWRSWLALAVLRFGLSPTEFWRLSLGEWRALCAGLAPAGPALTRARLDALRRAFPDHGEMSA